MGLQLLQRIGNERLTFECSWGSICRCASRTPPYLRGKRKVQGVLIPAP